MQVTALEISQPIPLVSVMLRLPDGRVTRQVYAPGDDITTAPQAVRDAAALHWTPEAVAGYRAALAAGNSRAASPGERLADLRWRRETGGIEVGGMRVVTSRESQSQITATLNALTLGMIKEPVTWKMGSGWVDLSAAQIAGVAAAVASHVKACFDAERAVGEQLGVAPDPDSVDIDTAFDTAYAAIVVRV